MILATGRQCSGHAIRCRYLHGGGARGSDATARGVQFVNGQFMSTLVVGAENQGRSSSPTVGSGGGRDPGTDCQTRPEHVDAHMCHFAGWDQRRSGPPCVRASGGRLCVSSCDFMAEGKQPIVLEKGLRAATITGCLFRGEQPIADSSAADVQSGLNTTH